MSRNYYNLPQRQKFKRYKSFLDDNEQHEQSIIKKYGMPKTARPPKLPEDVIEKIQQEVHTKPEEWNSL